MLIQKMCIKIQILLNDNVIPLNNRKKSTKIVAIKPDYLKE